MLIKLKLNIPAPANRGRRVTKHRNYRQAAGFTSKKTPQACFFFEIAPPQKKTTAPNLRFFSQSEQFFIIEVMDFDENI
jgi:hypothetical protein